jgi:hypothetical protein
MVAAERDATACVHRCTIDRAVQNSVSRAAPATPLAERGHRTLSLLFLLAPLWPAGMPQRSSCGARALGRRRSLCPPERGAPARNRTPRSRRWRCGGVSGARAAGVARGAQGVARDWDMHVGEHQ